MNYEGANVFRDVHVQSSQSVNEGAICAALHGYFLQVQSGRLYPSCIPMEQMQHVLDVGCGAGEWLFDLAKQHPNVHMYGLDASEELLHQAQVRRNMASLRQIELRHSDLSHGLPVPSNSMDVAHMRLFSRYMRPHAWLDALHGCVRVVRPGGWVTIVEMELCEISGSACQMLYRSALQARTRLGQTLDESGLSLGLAQRLYGLLLQEPLDEVGYDLYALDLGYLGGSWAHLFLTELLDTAIAVKPLLVQQGILTLAGFDMLVSEAQQELQDPLLCGWALLVSAYGRKTSD